MTSDPFEQRLSMALKAVSAHAYPETPLALPGISESASIELLGGESIGPVGTCDPWDPNGERRSIRRLGVRRVTAVVVLTLGIGSAGVGIAAATGVFSTTVGTRLIAPARGQLSQTGHWTAANVVSRVSQPGPDGSTITLQTSSSERYNGCVHLGVTGPTEPAKPGVVVCGQVFKAASPPTTSTPSTSYFPSGQWPWSTPAGESFMVLYGKAPSGTVAAKLVHGSTGAVVVSDIPLSSGFYLYPIPSSSSGGNEVEFFNGTGNEVGTAPG
jgi:hypothetical protein